MSSVIIAIYCFVTILYMIKFIEKCFNNIKIYTGHNRRRQYKSVVHIEFDSKM